MTDYHIRTDKGQITAFIDAYTAGKLINEKDGKWVEKKFTTGKESVYVFDCEMFTYGSDSIRLIVNPGYYIMRG